MVHDHQLSLSTQDLLVHGACAYESVS